MAHLNPSPAIRRIGNRTVAPYVSIRREAVSRPADGKLVEPIERGAVPLVALPQEGVPASCLHLAAARSRPGFLGYAALRSE